MKEFRFRSTLFCSRREYDDQFKNDLSYKTGPCEATVRKLLFVCLIFSASLCLAQAAPATDAATFAAELMRYEVHPNIVYHAANNFEAKLDVYQPADATQPTPVVIVIHGGGWIAGTKEERVLEMAPYLQTGFAAVNVEYRLAQSSLAPAAVSWWPGSSTAPALAPHC